MSARIAVIKRVTATGNMTADRGRPVTYNSGTGVAALATAANVKPWGVIEAAENASGGWVDVVVFGEASGLAGAAVVDGVFVSAAADSQLDPTGAGEYYVGYTIAKVDIADEGYFDLFVCPGIVET